MPIRIGSNEFWGRRFGGYFNPFVPKGQKEPFGFAINTSKFGSRQSNSGTSANTPETAQAKKDKAKYILNGRPTLTYSANRKRVYQ